MASEETEEQAAAELRKLVKKGDRNEAPAGKREAGGELVDDLFAEEPGWVKPWRVEARQAMKMTQATEAERMRQAKMREEQAKAPESVKKDATEAGDARDVGAKTRGDAVQGEPSGRVAPERRPDMARAVAFWVLGAIFLLIGLVVTGHQIAEGEEFVFVALEGGVGIGAGVAAIACGWYAGRR